jgi:tetratricopeptide (TPR) repeat protein
MEPPRRAAPREPVVSTLLGMPAVSASPSLSTKPYSRVVGDVRLTAPSLSDRAASAQEVVKLCEKALTTEKEKNRRARLHTEIARLSEVVLSNVEAAAQNFQKAHGYDPTFEPAISGLLRVRARQGQWEGTLPLFDQQIELTASPEDKAALLFTKAVVLEERLKRPQDARSDYEKALSLVPNQVALLLAVARCARRDQDWKSLDHLLAGLSQPRGADVGLSAAHMAERARVAEHHRKQPGEAVQFYQKALSTDPMATSAIYALERLYAVQKQTRDHVSLLSTRARLIEEPASRAAALASAGALLAETLDEPAEAAQLYEFAWSAEPTNVGFLQTLEELYRRAGDFAGVVRVLERLIDMSQAPNETSDLCLRLADVLHQRLGRQAEAIQYLERARELEPARADCVMPLVEHYAQTKAWRSLVQVLVQEEAKSDDPERRADVHCKIAWISEMHLNSPKDAVHHYQAALGLRPLDSGAFRELSRLLEVAGRYEELVELHLRAVEVESEVPVALVHLFKVGQVLEDLLKAPLRALPVYRQILEKQPGHLGALYALARAAHRAGDHAAVVEALIQESEVHSAPAKKVPLLHRAATICADDLGQSQRALALYQQVLGLDPKYAPTLDALAALYEAEGRHAELLKVLILKLNYLKTTEARRDHLLRMGRACEEHLRQDEKALGYYKKCLEVAPDSGVAARAVERCLERLARFEELSVFLHERVKGLSDPVSRAQVSLRLGQVYELRLAKLQNAIVAYEAALEDAPGLTVARDGLIRVLEQRADFTKTTAALEARAESTADAAVKLWAMLRRAEILENTSPKTDAPISAYKAIIDLDPRQVQTLTALCRLYELNNDDHRLTRALRLHATALSDPENQAGVMRELLRLAEAKLDPAKPQEGASSEATPQLPDLSSALLVRYPGDRTALRYAELSAIASKNFEQLAAVDAHYAQIKSQPLLASAHRTRLGEFLEPRNPVQALEQHRPALLADRENIGSARGITRVAETILEPKLLLEAAELEAVVVRSVERSASLSVRAAQVLAAAGKTEEAVSSLKKALSVYPDSILAAQTLHEMLSLRSDFEDLASTLTSAAQSAATAEARAEHWIAVAKLYADELGDLPAAIAALRRLDKDGIKNLPATLELSELLVRDRQWKEAVVQLEKAVLLKPEPQVLVAVRLRLAEIYHEHLHQLIDATQELRAVLQDEPKHVAALRRLLAIQMKEKAPAAAETAGALAEVSSGRERAEALVALGKLQAQAKKWSEALQPFASAIALIGLEPPDAALGMKEILEHQAGEAGAWAGYTKALSLFCQESEPGDHQARVYTEWGKTLAEKEKELKGAVKALTRGLAQNGSSLELRRELVKRLRAAHMYQEALPELLTLQKAEPLNGEIWSELVEVYDALGQNAESHLATGPLVLLGKGTTLQISTWKSRVPRPALVGAGAFGPEAISQCLVQGVSLEAVGLLEQLSSHLPKIYPPTLSNYGTSTRERIGSRDAHPCRAVLTRLCHSMGVPEMDLYLSDAVQQITLIYSDPYGLVIPSSVGDLSEAGQAFYLGSFVASVARGMSAAFALGEEDFSLILGASVRVLSPDAEVPDVNQRRLGQMTKKLSKALPWLSKGRFEDAARRYAAAPLADVTEFRRQVQISSLRAALVLCDDVDPVRLLEKSGAELLGYDASRVPALIADLLAFWASPTSVNLRRQVGML